MRQNIIDDIREAANSLDPKAHYAAVFALRWIAFEGTIVRACVKALWMRGSSVRKAETAIRLPRYRTYSPLQLLAKSCGVSIEKVSLSTLRSLTDVTDTRNELFHKASIRSRADVDKASKLLDAFVYSPKNFLSYIPVSYPRKTRVGTTKLGDTKLDLRKNRNHRPHDGIYPKGGRDAEDLLDVETSF